MSCACRRPAAPAMATRRIVPMRRSRPISETATSAPRPRSATMDAPDGRDPGVEDFRFTRVKIPYYGVRKPTDPRTGVGDRARSRRTAGHLMDKTFRFSNSHADFQARDARSVFGWRYSPRIIFKAGKGTKLVDLDDTEYYDLTSGMM